MNITAFPYLRVLTERSQLCPFYPNAVMFGLQRNVGFDSNQALEEMRRFTGLRVVGSTSRTERNRFFVYGWCGYLIM